LSTTGDGVLTGVQTLLALNRKSKILTDSKTIFSKVPQVLINVPVESNAEQIIKDIKDEINVASMELGDGGRILVRPSGTEPLVRVMVETLDPALANSIAEHLANLVTRKDQRFL
jgi:phosphoglucosamine mutase